MATFASTSGPAPGTSLNPFGQAFYTKMRWCGRIAAGGGAFAYDNAFLSLNNLYDPALLEGGKRPTGWAELSELYNFYRVYSCKVKVTAVNTSTTIPVVWGVKVGTLGTPGTYSTIDEFMAAPGSKYTTGAPAGTEGAKSMTVFADMAALYGTPKYEVRTDDNYGATVGDATGPANTTNLTLWVTSTDQASIPTVTFLVELVFYVQWSDRKQVTLGPAP